MKRFLSYIIITLLLACGLFPVGSVSAKNVNDFYFKDAQFDYYLEKATDGSSKMHVKEVLTAVFPETNQNHGITRTIPYTNQGGENLTAESKSALNFSVKRNDKKEKYDSETENGYFFFKIGDADRYVHGEQVYTLEYDFTNIITAFDSNNTITYSADNTAFQELYWDTNGTGWSQKFDSLTARVHLPRDIAKNILPKTSCYVGKYGASGTSRCIVSSDDETTYNIYAENATSGKAAETVITFKTTNLSAGENLTFAIDFTPGTFNVKEPAKSYFAIAFLAAQIIITGLAILWATLYYVKHASSKRKLNKSLFVKPEYAPPKNLTVAESALVYIKTTKPSRVATLLEMAIRKNIEIIKSEKDGVFKKKLIWKIKVNKLTGLTDPEEDILKILNGGTLPEVGETFEVKRHRATSTLESINRDYTKSSERMLKSKGLFEDKIKGTVLYTLLGFFGFFLYFMGFMMLIVSPKAHFMVGLGLVALISVPLFIASIIAISILGSSAYKYAKRTDEGVRTSKYLEGLELYITMAEEDRIKFLQSVKGVDTSNKGICKLYEKLLPYACIFGVEESWLAELNKYYEITPSYNHGWYSGTDLMNFAIFHSMMTATTSTIASSTSYSSSSSSGGGGGGFSGGGGGGGGGGGW